MPPETTNPSDKTSIHGLGHVLGRAAGAVRTGFGDLIGAIRTGFSDLAAGVQAGYARAAPAIANEEKQLVADGKAVAEKLVSEVLADELPKAVSEATAAVNVAPSSLSPE